MLYCNLPPVTHQKMAFHHICRVTAFTIFLTVCLLPYVSTQLNDSEDFPRLRIDPESNQIIDDRGRVRVFHGVNLVAKHPPWYHADLLDSKYAQQLSDWGLNVVRLGTMWSGIEPLEESWHESLICLNLTFFVDYHLLTMGQYNQTYLDILRKIVKNFEDHGIWVLLDVHQDVAAKEFGTYDGFPSWLIKKLRTGTEKGFPWPLERIDNWFCGYITYEACEVYQRFYDNHYGAADKFADMWKQLVITFKDAPNVIGYNLINEPWAGNVYKDGTLILPGEVGRKNLQPLYDKLAATIRELDTNKLIFWEAVTWSHWGPQFNNAFLNKIFAGYFRRHPALTWLNGISKACGSLNLSISSSDADFCQGLQDHSRTLGDRLYLTDCLDANAANTAAVLGQGAGDGGSQLQVHDSVFGSGLTHVPGGSQYQDRSVMSWHYYFPLLVYETQEYPWYYRQFAHKVFGPTVFKGAQQDIKKLGGGQFLTEFGICQPDYSRPDYWGTVEFNWIMEKVDQNTMSWCYWDTSNMGFLWDAKGDPRENAVKSLSRPYPLVVAGTNLTYKYDTTKVTFSLEFLSQASVPHGGQPTSNEIRELLSPDDLVSKIYIPKMMFGDQPVIHVSDDLDYYFSDDRQIVILRRKIDSSSKKSWIMIGKSGEQLEVPFQEQRSWSWLLKFFTFFRAG